MSRPMTEEERDNYILAYSMERDVEKQIRLVLPLVAGELTGDYPREAHIRTSRYSHDVKFLLEVIDQLRARLDVLRGKLQ